MRRFIELREDKSYSESTRGLIDEAVERMFGVEKELAERFDCK